MKIDLHKTETLLSNPKQENSQRWSGRDYFPNWSLLIKAAAAKRFTLIVFCAIFFNSNVVADYTIPLGVNRDVTWLLANLTPAELSGTLTINGTLTVSSNQSLGYAAVIINGSAGSIFWSANKDLSFNAGTTFDINSPGLTGGLQPTGGSAAKSLTIGSTTIAVSNTTSNNAAFSFAEFNNAGGVPKFSIASSVASSSCYLPTFTATVTPLDNFIAYDCIWSINTGSISPATKQANSSGAANIATITPLTTTQTYTITCNLFRSGDNDLMLTKTVTVTINTLPTVAAIGGGASSVCINASTPAFTNATPGGSWSVLNGTGTASNVGGVVTGLTAGTATVKYTTAANANGCVNSTTTPLTVIPLPTAFSLTGGGNYCSGGTGKVIGLTNSQTGVNYQLQIGGVNTGAAVSGTGAAISFGLKTTAGTYTVVATNTTTTCTANMSGSAIIALDPLPTVTVAASTVCGGAPANIMATPGSPAAYTYAWTYPAGATNPGNVATFNSLITGNYSVVITNTSTGCVSAPSAAANVVAAANTWTGNNSSDWQDLANWSCAAIPTAISDVVIPSSAPHMPVLTQASFTKSLELQGSAVITLNGQTLNNAGGISLTGTGLGSFIGSPASGISINAPGTSSTIKLTQGADGTTNALNNLTINGAGASVTLNSKTALYGALTPTLGTLIINDELVLRSSSVSTASVGQVGGVISYGVSGKVTVERYFPATRNWHLFTGPVSGGGSIFDNWQNGGANVPGKGALVTGTVYPGIGLDGPSPNLKSSLEVGDQTLTAVNDTKGTYLSKPLLTSAANIPYFIFVRGDRNPANFTAGVSDTTVLSSTGKLQTGNQTFNVNANGFTMIGNPYASPVDFLNLTKTNVTDALYVWDPYLNLTGGYVTFAEHDPVNAPGVYSAVPASPGHQTSIIQSGQAFYVSNPTFSPGALTFTESAKSAINNLAIYKAKDNSPASSLTTNLYTYINKDSLKLVDGNLAQFDTSYSAGVDWQDAKKFPNINETFGLLCNGISLVADRRPPLAMHDTLLYNLTKTTAKRYQFELLAVNLGRDNLAGFVNDNFLHTATPISLNGSTRINFEVTTDKASSAADRFMVVFKPSVEYTTVTAAVLGSDIVVGWSVADEANIKSYTIERSVDGVHFAAIGDQLAAGKNSAITEYTWLDAAPAVGTYYYRVRSVSYNDVIGYSNTVKVKLNRSIPAMYVFPNPVTDNTIHLQMNGMAKGVYKVSLLNSLGQLLQGSLINNMGGTVTETLRVGSILSRGVFQLRITAPDTKITSIKVIVP